MLVDKFRKIFNFKNFFNKDLLVFLISNEKFASYLNILINSTKFSCIYLLINYKLKHTKCE